MLALNIITPTYATEPKTPEQRNQAMAERFSIQEDIKEEYLGEFTLSFYCGCEKCNGKWTNQPAKNGQELVEGYTIAVDTSVIPLNSWVRIEGFGKYKACDTGSAIKNNKIDIYMANHEKCLKMGLIRNVKVYKEIKK